MTGLALHLGMVFRIVRGKLDDAAVVELEEQCDERATAGGGVQVVDGDSVTPALMGDPFTSTMDESVQSLRCNSRIKVSLTLLNSSGVNAPSRDSKRASEIG